MKKATLAIIILATITAVFFLIRNQNQDTSSAQVQTRQEVEIQTEIPATVSEETVIDDTIDVIDEVMKDLSTSEDFADIEDF